MRLVHYAAGAASTRCGDGAAGTGHMYEAVDAKGDEGEDNEENDDDDGDGVVLFDHDCGCALGVQETMWCWSKTGRARKFGAG